MTDEEIEQKVDEWHESDDPRPLHEYLGLNIDEYQQWLDGFVEKRAGDFFRKLGLLLCEYEADVIGIRDNNEVLWLVGDEEYYPEDILRLKKSGLI